jgi:hypothetical protein
MEPGKIPEPKNPGAGINWGKESNFVEDVAFPLKIVKLQNCDKWSQS